MIWWVYNNVSSLSIFDKVVCAIDDERVEAVCRDLGMQYIMTSPDAPNHISRVWEVSERMEADYYVCVNGDEPALDPHNVSSMMPSAPSDDAFVMCAMRRLTDPAETVDFSKIKVVVDAKQRGIYMSRTPVPYPRGTLSFEYNKYVGIEVFNKKALNLFNIYEPGKVEVIEDIDHLRFIENRIPILFRYVDSEAISVDTPKDLDRVREMISKGL